MPAFALGRMEVQQDLSKRYSSESGSPATMLALYRASSSTDLSARGSTTRTSRRPNRPFGSPRRRTARGATPAAPLHIRGKSSISALIRARSRARFITSRHIEFPSSNGQYGQRLYELAICLRSSLHVERNSVLVFLENPVERVGSLVCPLHQRFVDSHLVELRQ